MNSWIFFALLSPLLWAISNVLDSAARRHYVKNDYALTWFLAATRIPLIIIFFIIFGFETPSLEAVLMMLTVGVLWILPFALYYKALEFEEPSRVVLLLQLNPLWILLIAFLLIGERLNSLQSVAFILLLAGGTLASFKHSEGKWRFSRAWIYIVIATFFWAIADVVFKKYVTEFSGFWPAFSWQTLGSFIPAALIVLFHKGREMTLHHFKNLPARGWKLLAVDQLIGISGSAAFAYALTLGHTSLTAVFIGIQPLLVMIFTRILRPFLHEIYPEELHKSALLTKGISLVFIVLGLFLIAR